MDSPASSAQGMQCKQRVLSWRQISRTDKEAHGMQVTLHLEDHFWALCVSKSLGKVALSQVGGLAVWLLEAGHRGKPAE